MRSTCLTCLLALATMLHHTAEAQILYGVTNGNLLIKIDVENCTLCPVMTLNGVQAAADVLILPNGDILTQSFSSGGLRRYTPPNPNPVFSVGGSFGGSILSPGGLVYLSSINPTGLYVFDPSNNSLVYLGDWPSGASVAEFFYDNGELYGFGQLNGVQVLYLINTSDPGQSVVVHSPLPPIGNGGTTNGVYSTAFLGGDFLTQYDAATNTIEVICDFSDVPGLNAITALTDIPPGVAELPCQCTTNAGTVTPGTTNVCINTDAPVPYNGNASLDNNDLLQYILFSDPTDTLGSIVAISNTPSFSFDPATMQTGVPYYLAAIAGDNLNGNVDLDDPCLDISDTAAQIIWQPLPSIALTADNATVCGVGNCQTVVATLTGTPPFVFSYEFWSGGAPVGAGVTVSAPGSPHSFLVCPPGPEGAVQVSVCTLQDAYCTVP
jgi:hypothetical protein